MNPWDVEPPKGFKSWREFSLAGNVVDTNYLLTEAYNRIAALEAERDELRQELADAAAEIPMRGRLPERIRAFREQHRKWADEREAENAKLRERIGALEVFLLNIEWQLDPEDGGEYCPACKMGKRLGHRDCGLAALLTEER